MSRPVSSAIATATLLVLVAPLAGQANPFSGGERYYKGGSAVVKVTGSFAFDREIPLTREPSYTDAEGYTWLVYGDETSGEPFVIFTYNDYGYGITVGRDRRNAVAEFAMCEGKVDVTATKVVGDYTCPEVESMDRNFTPLKVSIAIRFTADSGGSYTGPPPPAPGDPTHLSHGRDAGSPVRLRPIHR